MRKVFLDTNVFDDLFMDGPAAADTAFILEFIKRRLVMGCTSPKTLMDIYYLFHSERGASRANKYIKQVYALVEITSQGAREVRDAFSLGWTDFEDAMQMASAKNAGADRIITLDKKFRNKDKSYIWTPSDLKSYLIQNTDY
jgi:predicted nucleic acid-binding protein